MTQEQSTVGAIQSRSRWRLRGPSALLMSCAALWFAAQRGGDWYARAVHRQQMDECAQRMGRFAETIRAFQKDRSLPSAHRVTVWDVYPKYLPNAADLLCPADDTRSEATQSKNLDASFVLCFRNPSWEHVHRRRGDATPILACPIHSSAKVSNRTANLVRLRGPVERIQIPPGVETLEW